MVENVIFIEYERLKRKYDEAQGAFAAVLDEKAELFAATQPSGIKYDVEKVSGGGGGDPFATYLAQKERLRIDERLDEAKRLAADRLGMLKAKEREMRASKCLFDVIYCLRIVDNMHVKKIAKRIGYSRPQVYRLIEKVEKMRQNETLSVL